MSSSFFLSSFVTAALLSIFYWIGRWHQRRITCRAIDTAAEAKLSSKPTPEALSAIRWPVSVGDRFRYVGVQMLCVRRLAVTYMADGPVIESQYLNYRGEIQTFWIGEEIWPALRAEVERATEQGRAKA